MDAVLGTGGLFGVGSGIFISSSFALVTDIVPSTEAGRYLGIANIANGGGAAIAHLLECAVIDPLNKFSGSSTTGYLTLFSIAALLFIISMLAALRLPSWKEASKASKTDSKQLR
jgi:MFS family permease